MEQFRPRSACESTAESQRASDGRPHALAIGVWVRLLVAFAVIGLWVWSFVVQVRMQPTAYSLPFEEWYGNWSNVFVVSAVFLVFVLGLLVVVAFNIQWPTILTLAMAPVLIVAYVRQARREDKELEARFGKEFVGYASRVPAFIPRLRGRTVLTEQTENTR